MISSKLTLDEDLLLDLPAVQIVLNDTKKKKYFNIVSVNTGLIELQRKEDEIFIEVKELQPIIHEGVILNFDCLVQSLEEAGLNQEFNNYYKNL